MSGVLFDEKVDENNLIIDEKEGKKGNGDLLEQHGDYLKFSVIEVKFFRKFGLSEQEELLSCWDCRLDLYVPRNGKLFLSRHPSQGGHICFSSCKLNKSNVKRCIPLVEVVHMEKKEATITNLKYYGVRGICFHFADGTQLQFSRFEDRDSVWDTIKDEWERSRSDALQQQQRQQQQQHEEDLTRKKNKKKKKEVVCTNPPIKKKNKKKKTDVVPSRASSCGLLMITILEARGLPHTYMSSVGFVEPCCTLSFGTQVFQTEAAGRNKGACTWNEKFNIALYSHEEATTLELTVDDGENRIIGTFQAAIADFLAPTPIDKWVALETQQSKGFYFDAQHQFQVHFRSEFKAKEEIQHIFWKECVSVFDSDNDGKIDLTEAMSMLKVLGCNLPEDEINELYHVIDVNNDGAISPDDLVRFSASGSESLLSLLVKRCPLCGYHLSTIDEEVIYHLGICVFDDISKSLLVRMMVVPLGSVLRMSKKKLKKGKKAPSFLVMDRQTGKLIPEIIPQRLRVLMKTVYGNKIGNKVMLTNRATRLLERASINQGMKFDHPSSLKDIDLFIRYYKIDTNELADPIESFGCFNEFFYRKLGPGARPVAHPEDPEVCVSAADARLMVFNNVSEATRLWIKGRNFSIESLLDDEQLAETFKGGSIAVYRLAPQDYHRFHMPVDGHLGPPRAIAGNYHTVNPLAINSQVLNVFTENKRTINLIDSPQFGLVAYVAIGATLVGSIIHTGSGNLRRGDEVGYFAFGGSTIITLFTKGAVKFDDDLLLNSSQPLETLVRVGERVGRKRRPDDDDGAFELMYAGDEPDGVLSPMEGDESDAVGTEEDSDGGTALSGSPGGFGGKDTIMRGAGDDDGSSIIMRSGAEGGSKRNFATKTKNTIMLGTKLISPMKFKHKRSGTRDDSDLPAPSSSSSSSSSAPSVAFAPASAPSSPPMQRRGGGGGSGSGSGSESGTLTTPGKKKDKQRSQDQAGRDAVQPGGGSGGNRRGSRIWRRRDTHDGGANNNNNSNSGKKEGGSAIVTGKKSSPSSPYSRSSSSIGAGTSASSSSASSTATTASGGGSKTKRPLTPELGVSRASSGSSLTSSSPSATVSMPISPAALFRKHHSHSAFGAGAQGTGSSSPHSSASLSSSSPLQPTTGGARQANLALSALAGEDSSQLRRRTRRRNGPPSPPRSPRGASPSSSLSPLTLALGSSASSCLPQTTPTGSPASSPRGPLGIDLAAFAPPPPSPFFDRSATATTTTAAAAAAAAAPMMASVAARVRLAQEEAAEAVEAYELAAASVIEGLVLDHLGFAHHHHGGESHGHQHQHHQHHQHHLQDEDDNDDMYGDEDSDEPVGKGKEISPDVDRHHHHHSNGDGGKAAGSRRQQPLPLRRSEGSATASSGGGLAFKASSSSSPQTSQQLRKRPLQHSAGHQTSNGLEQQQKQLQHDQAMLVEFNNNHNSHKLQVPHQRHHPHHHHMHQHDEDEDDDLDEALGGSRKHHVHQIYPPPGHPYRYQTAPYTFDLDDCFEDEYDEVDEQMFEDLQRDLDLTDDDDSPYHHRSKHQHQQEQTSSLLSSA